MSGLTLSGGYEADPQDRRLMQALGLKTTGFGREWTELGTVSEGRIAHVFYGGEENDERVSVKVEVISMPARFWRFTVTRVNEDTDEPETFVITTGSNGAAGGGFRHYFQTARYIATNMMSVERVTP